tara:strand:- start:252 stop:578 length:327 start_codon:yes stop_codon:yes gene_type:complete
MRFQIDNPLTEEEQEGVAVLDRARSTERAKKLGRQEKTPEEIRAEQEERDRERREKDAKEMRELDERDKERYRDAVSGRLDYEKNLGRSGGRRQKKRGRRIPVRGRKQ